MAEKAEAIGQAASSNTSVYIPGKQKLATYAFSKQRNTATYLPLKYLASCRGSQSSGHHRQKSNDGHNDLQDCLSLPQI
jgi:hypothetical protein